MLEELNHETFKELVETRKYKEAREYLNDLSEETRTEMIRDNRLNRYFRILRCSTL